jgi:hypothetical protein
MTTNAEAASLLAGLDLGSTVAELDTVLEGARVETSVFEDLLADRVDLIPGTKGSGKTALYRIFVDFLPKVMLSSKRVIIAHGVQQRQDTVFLAYRKEFDQLSEADFVDFWCIYVVSLAYEQGCSMLSTEAPIGQGVELSESGGVSVLTEGAGSVTA